MNAIISVVGKDTVGILAAVATKCADYNVNINDVNQTIVNDYFTMYMIVNIDKISIDFNEFVDIMAEVGTAKNLKINVMHEDIFDLMHKI